MLLLPPSCLDLTRLRGILKRLSSQSSRRLSSSSRPSPHPFIPAHSLVSCFPSSNTITSALILLPFAHSRPLVHAGSWPRHIFLLIRDWRVVLSWLCWGVCPHSCLYSPTAYPTFCHSVSPCFLESSGLVHPFCPHPDMAGTQASSMRHSQRQTRPVHLMYTSHIHLMYTSCTPPIYTSCTPDVHLIYTSCTPDVHLMYT